MQTLVVIFESGTALGLALAVLIGAVDDVAAEKLLPEGEAPRRA